MEDKRLCSNISLDSLELESKKKSSPRDTDKIVETILVPFYEKDVLIRITKGNKKQQKATKKLSKRDTYVGEEQQCRGYLMNKNYQIGKKTSYLEMFRKQFSSNINQKMSKDPNEIRSISPEFGDTERESFGEDYNNNVVTEFYNTEAYNEMYYEQLMNQELEQYLNYSFEDGLYFNGDIGSKSQEDIDDNNLRSISEVSRPRHRRTTAPISQNIQLGGLGPDMENIKPRLERAKSLQRYSEKVRMENRLKFYKKETEAENEKKQAEKENSAKRQGSSNIKSKEQKGKKSSYLVDKPDNKYSNVKKKFTKSKSAKVKEREIDNPTKDSDNSKEKECKPNQVIESKLLSAKESLQKYIKAGYETTRKKSSAKSRDLSSEKNQSYGHSSRSHEAEVTLGGAQSSENRWTGARCWNGDLARVNAALVDPSRKQEAAGSKRHKTLVFGTPYNRPIFSSGR
ncbi:jg8734 [Pararge aegeria aegeria]|uniref:Jg8734 protein n=1 Tax=Pararge aegeria aegeria TaxID=348720 RepID=A0A8S4S5D8_9NEOP|nr:jg8734 [Pararge aegeria aegeria]